MTLTQLYDLGVVRGISVGWCADGSRINPKHAAHAHCGPSKWRGWICVRSPRDILEPGRSQQLSRDLRHELSHLQTEFEAAHGIAFDRAQAVNRKAARRKR